METEQESKKAYLTVAALVFLLFTRWMLFVIELDIELNLLCYIIESVLFISIYTMGFFRLSKPVILFCLTIGCIIIGCFRFFSEGHSAYEALLPLSYYPVFVFYIYQNGYRKEKVERIIRKITAVEMTVIPIIIFGVIVSYIYKGYVFTGQKNQIAFNLLIFVLVGIIYGWIAMLSQMKQSKKKQKRTERKTGDLHDRRKKTVFIFAVITIIETGVYLLFSRQEALTLTVPLLWLINLMFLYEQKHSLVSSFSDRLKKFSEENRCS